MKDYKLVFIGAGHMTGAIVSGIVTKGYPAEKITVCAPSEGRRDVLAKKWGVVSSADNITAIRHSDVVIFSVKPQQIVDLCRELYEARINFSDKLILSVVAGVSISRFYTLLHANLNMIRMMPNTPAKVGQGMTALFASEEVDEADRDFTTQLMSSVGKVCWVKTEADINKVIAVSGSAPAYFFLFMKAMEQEALHQGFDHKTARLLIQQAAIGACSLVEKSPSLSLSDLRQQVTSKGGTTEAAVAVFNQRGLSDMVSSAMKAVIARAEVMEKTF